MLVDAWKLAKALESAGIFVTKRSADVATPGKTGGPCLRVCIAQDFAISILPVSDEGLESLWTFRQGNFHFWPVIRPSAPLCNSAEVERVLNLVKNTPKRVDDIRKNEMPCANPDIVPLCNAEKTEREHHNSKIADASGPLQKLADRLAYLYANPNNFKQALMEARTKDDLYPALFSIFFGKLDKNNVKPSGQIAFDLAEETIYSAAIRSAIENQLCTITNLHDRAASSDVHCAFANAVQPRHQGKLPNPSIPIIATSGIAMFSMFNDAPTNTRYGLSDSDILSVSKLAVQQAHDALKYTTSNEMKGRMWKAFPNGKKDGKRELADLLIGYAKDIQVVDLFDATLDQDDNNQTYEVAVKIVLDALTGLNESEPAAEIVLILLRQISNAQIQSVFCRTPKASAVLKAGEQWRKAQEERIGLLTESKDITKRKYLSPGSVVRLLSKNWGSRPPKATGLNGPSGGDIIDFFLSTGNTRRIQAKYLLSLTLQRLDNLLIYIGEERRKQFKNTENKQTANPEPNDKLPSNEADRAAFLITILLHAMDINMETITYSPAYLLGLLLGLVDRLHLAYHRVVRKEEDPGALGGSQLLGIAADDPARALEELLDRIRPWRDWAYKLPENDIAKQALDRIGLVSPMLTGRFSADERLKDIDKAELLLGFLSRDEQADQYKKTE